MIDAALGVAAHQGWVAVSIIVPRRRTFDVLGTERLATALPDDRLAQEPYHVAGGFDGLARVPPPADPAAAVREGLARQRRATAVALRALARRLEAGGHRLTSAAVLTGRGRAARALSDAIGSHTQIHIEEGLAVRDSVIRALARLGITAVPCDQKTLPVRAAQRLGIAEAGLFEHLKAFRPATGAWRREHQLAALAAFIAT